MKRLDPSTHAGRQKYTKLAMLELNALGGRKEIRERNYLQ